MIGAANDADFSSSTVHLDKGCFCKKVNLRQTSHIVGTVQTYQEEECCQCDGNRPQMLCEQDDGEEKLRRVLSSTQLVKESSVEI